MALAELGAELAEDVQAGLVLDPLGDDVEAERVAERDHAAHDGLLGPAAARRQAEDEGAVDLEHVDHAAPELGERGEPGPEVVEDDAHPEATEVGELRARVAERRGLRELEPQPGGRQAALLERARDDLEEVAPLDLPRGEVDRDPAPGPAGGG